MSRKYLAFDLETGIKQALKRKASPFYGLNPIWAVGYRGSGVMDKVGFHRTIGGIPSTWFTDMLDKCQMLVGFNIKFDLLHSLQDPANYSAWKKWVAAGGAVWDGQLAEYLLQGMDQKWHMASMDETAPLYGGNLKDDAVKACWNNGIDTGDIDPDMLMDYLMGTGDDDIGDIGNTERIFLGQLTLARERGQLRSILLNNGALLYTIEAELNGMKIDKARAEELRLGLVEKLAVVAEEVGGYIPADLPFEFKWTSRFHKSALLFGGNIKYQLRVHQKDEAGQLAYALKDERQVLMSDGSTKAEADMVGLDWTLAQRNAGGAKKGMPKTKLVKVPDMDKPKMKFEDFFSKFDGFVEALPNWESKDAEGKGTGVFSTSSDVIEELGKWLDAPPFIKAYASMQKISKDLSTYYWVEDSDGARKGMLSLLGPDDIIHHALNMVNTVTARLSSSDPNLQNIPKGDKSDVKTVFVSRFEDGYIVQSDFTSLEVYVQANLSLDPNLIADLKTGMDMHCVRVSQAHKMDYNYVLARAKDEDHPEHAHFKGLRNKAKNFSFQRAYGAGAKAIAAATGMSVEEVEALIRAEEERYPGVVRYNDKNLKMLERNRRPSKLFVQHDSVKHLKNVNLGKSFLTTPDGKRYTLWESCSMKHVYEREGKETSFKPTTLKNYPVQGMGGEWAKAAMWLLVRAFYEEDNFGGKALLVNQVHDAVYADVDASVRVEAMALIHACMLESSVLMEQHFNWEVAVPVPTETVYGRSMSEEKGAEADIISLAEVRRKKVREKYLGSYAPSFEQEKAA